MTKHKALPSQALLLELLDYDPATGWLTWKKRSISHFNSEAHASRWNTRYPGKPALHNIGSQGYRTGAILGTSFSAHRIIWKMLYGVDPDMIDHINGIRSDNRKGNLTDVDFHTNMRNQRLSKNNTSKVVGVYRYRTNRKWIARICVNHKQITLGSFTDYDDAVAARREAELLYGFHPNHGNTI